MNLCLRLNNSMATSARFTSGGYTSRAEAQQHRGTGPAMFGLVMLDRQR